MIFDGKGEAEKIRIELERSGKFVGKSLLILSCDGSEKESLYVRLKREMGESLEVSIKLKVLSKKEEVREILENRIEESGVLVQLPLLCQGFGGQANRVSLEETQEIFFRQ